MRRGLKIGDWQVTLRKKHGANKYYSLIFIALSFTFAYDWWTRITLRKFIRDDEGERHEEGKGRDRDEEHVRQTGDKRMRQLRGSATGAQNGKVGRVGTLFNFRDSRNASCVARVPERDSKSRSHASSHRRSLPLRRIALRGIDFRSRARLPATKLVWLLPSIRKIMTVAGDDRCANNPDCWIDIEIATAA